MILAMEKEFVYRQFSAHRDFVKMLLNVILDIIRLAYAAMLSLKILVRFLQCNVAILYILISFIFGHFKLIISIYQHRFQRELSFWKRHHFHHQTGITILAGYQMRK